MHAKHRVLAHRAHRLENEKRKERERDVCFIAMNGSSNNSLSFDTAMLLQFRQRCAHHGIGSRGRQYSMAVSPSQEHIKHNQQPHTDIFMFEIISACTRRHVAYVNNGALFIHNGFLLSSVLFNALNLQYLCFHSVSVQQEKRL